VLEPHRLAARLVARYPDQGWSLLCNGVVVLDDGDQLLPDGRIAARSPRVPVGASWSSARAPTGRRFWVTPAPRFASASNGCETPSRHWRSSTVGGAGAAADLDDADA
jgi:hypothetical protein